MSTAVDDVGAAVGEWAANSEQRTALAGVDGVDGSARLLAARAVHDIIHGIIDGRRGRSAQHRRPPYRSQPVLPPDTAHGDGAPRTAGPCVAVTPQGRAGAAQEPCWPVRGRHTTATQRPHSGHTAAPERPHTPSQRARPALHRPGPPGPRGPVRVRGTSAAGPTLGR